MKYLFTSLFLAAILFSTKSYSQEPDSTKQAHVKFFTRELGVTGDKAELIVNIMADYKKNAKVLVANTTLSDDAKKAKIAELVTEKNSKLQKVLTKEQLQKLIPNSEIK
jgi:formyltetrahydrofolate hydrolase